jgi:WD40 repeat protein
MDNNLMSYLIYTCNRLKHVMVYLFSTVLFVCTFSSCTDIIHIRKLKISAGIHKLSTSDHLLVAVAMDNNVYIWDWNNLYHEPQKVHIDYWQNPVAYLSSGKIIECKTVPPYTKEDLRTNRIIRRKHEIVLRSVENNRVLHRWTLPEDLWFVGITKTNNERFVALGMADENSFAIRHIAIIEPNNYEDLDILPVTPDSPIAEIIEVSEDGSMVAGIRYVMNVQSGMATSMEKTKRWCSFDFPAFSRDGKILYTAGGSSQYVCLFDASSGKFISTWRLGGIFDMPYGFVVTGLTISPNGKMLVTTTKLPGYLCIWDIQNNNRLIRYECGDKAWGDPAFSPDSRLLATKGKSIGEINIFQIDK